MLDAAPTTSNALRVLIVEDSEGDTRLVLEELKDGGYAPTFRRVDTREAMSDALERGTWDIIISDYVMPRFSGPDALRLFRATGMDIPFIIVSGKIGEDTAVEAMKAGAHDYIMKGSLLRLVPAVERELSQAAQRRMRATAEEALRRSEAKCSDLREEEKRAAMIARLALMMAHELRNPLGTIGNSVQFMKMHPGTRDEKLSSHLDICSRSLASASRIMEDLLDYGRPKQPAFAPVSLNAVVEEALSACATGDRVVITRDLAADLPPISGDAEMLRRVFINLITNAVQAMPDGGSLRVRTRADGEWQEVAFTDSGVGIPVELQEKVFEPLFSTKTKGVGLGLYISRRTVTGHGGAISIESVPGRETTVTVRLPRQRKEPDGPKA